MTSHSQRTDILLVTSAHTQVDLAAPAVWQIVAQLVQRQWNSRVLVSEAPRLLLHTVATDDAEDPDGWLTWALDELGPSATRLTVSLSELDTAAPAPELDRLLALVSARSLHPAPERAGRPPEPPA
jgi:hypothetical protein